MINHTGLSAKNISHSYDNKHFVLSAQNHDFLLGNSYAIVGPSGCGKTTLLSILSGFLSPSQGEVCFANENIFTMDEAETSQLRNQTFGFVFQQSFFVAEKNVIENILLPVQYQTRFNQFETIETQLSHSTTRAYQLLEDLGLADKAKQFPEQLSGGEQQRVSFIRSIIQQPTILFADEPTGALDKNNAAILLSHLVAYANQGNIVIVVTHNNEVANACNHRIELSVQ